MNSKRKVSNLYSTRISGKKMVRRSWIPNVPGHPNYYVSKYGRVYKCVGYKIFKRVSTYSDGKSEGYLKCKVDCESWLLHRLVAVCWLPNPEGLPVVMHLNNNKRDCRVRNLKWGTCSDNMLQAWFDGQFKLPNKLVYYTDVHNLAAAGLSPRKIAEKLPIHISSVRRILKGKGLIRFKGKNKFKQIDF